MLNFNARQRPPRATFVVLISTLVCLARPPARADDLQGAQQSQARFMKGVILTEQGKQPEAVDVFSKLTQDFVVVTFEQDDRSSGLSNVMKKRQYWVKEDGRWKILYEGAG